MSKNWAEVKTLDNVIRIKSVEEDTDFVKFEGYASTGDVDLESEILDPSGWDLSKYKGILLYNHRFDDPMYIIGEGKAKKDDKGLYFKGRIVKSAENPLARWVGYLVKNGIIKTMSVRFIPKRPPEVIERNGKRVMRYPENILLEVSVTPLPANPNARIQYAKGLFDLPEHIEEEWGLKSVVPYKKYPICCKDEQWDANAVRVALIKWAGGPDKEKINWAKFKRGFAWYDETKPENITSYKFPHHVPRDGKLYTHCRGVTVAMAFVLGARGGVKLSEGDRRGIYNHLVKHYRDCGYENVPEFKSYTEEELRAMFPYVYELTEEAVKEYMEPSEYEIIADAYQSEILGALKSIRQDVNIKSVVSEVLDMLIENFLTGEDPRLKGEE